MFSRTKTAIFCNIGLQAPLHDEDFELASHHGDVTVLGFHDGLMDRHENTEDERFFLRLRIQQ